MSISSDEYKIEYCIITERECNEGSCKFCTVAEQNRQKQLQDERETYTLFEKSHYVLGYIMKINRLHTIAKTSVDVLFKLQTNNDISNDSVPYDPIYLKQYEKLLRKLRVYNKLSIPNKIYVKKNSVGAFVWNTDVYLIAPRIESG